MDKPESSLHITSASTGGILVPKPKPCSTCLCPKCIRWENKSTDDDVCRGRKEMLCGCCRGKSPKVYCQDYKSAKSNK